MLVAAPERMRKVEVYNDGLVSGLLEPTVFVLL